MESGGPGAQAGPDTHLLSEFGQIAQSVCVCAQLLSHVNSFRPLGLDCRLPGSSVSRIFQARILEWIAISSSRGSS